MHKHAKRLLALAALSLAATAASAQSWPTQPIRWIVPYPAGGGATWSRARSPAAWKTAGPDHRGREPPRRGHHHRRDRRVPGRAVRLHDRHRRFGHAGLQPSLYAKLSYDPSKFTYIGGIAKFPLLLAVNVNSPYKSVADVIAAAKKEPGKLTAASAGAGSPTIWRWSCSSSAPAPSCCTCPTGRRARHPGPAGRTGGRDVHRSGRRPAKREGGQAARAGRGHARARRRAARRADHGRAGRGQLHRLRLVAGRRRAGERGQKLSADLDATLKTPAVSQR